MAQHDAGLRMCPRFQGGLKFLSRRRLDTCGEIAMRRKIQPLKFLSNEFLTNTSAVPELMSQNKVALAQLHVQIASETLQCRDFSKPGVWGYFVTRNDSVLGFIGFSFAAKSQTLQDPCKTIACQNPEPQSPKA